jgi:phosphatidylinositol alpha-1,6-mannosyltransferase
MSGGRILILATEFPPGPGGIGTHAYELARWLPEYGWEVRVCACQDYAEREEILRFNERQPFAVSSLIRASLPGGRLVHLARGSARGRAWKPNVVLATGRNAVLAGAWTRWFHRKARLVAVAHGTELQAGGILRRRLARKAFQQSDLAIAVSGYTKRLLGGIGLEERRVLVVPNGADANRFQPATPTAVAGVRSKLGLGAGRAILTVGHVSERKGQETVVRALPMVAEKVPDVEYWMAGLPSQRRFLEELAARLGVAGRVRFLGRLGEDALAEVVQACDVFAMTSRTTADGDYEGYGIAVIEAALCGKPAVVSDCGGLPEAVLEGETGFVVPEGDAEATARALVRLLADAGLRQQMGEAARRRALAEGTWEKRAGQYDRVLRELVSLGGIA